MKRPGAQRALVLVLLVLCLPRIVAAAEPPPATPPDSVLTLEWLERAVLARNSTLTAARAGLDEARARASRSGALADPMLDAMSAPRSWNSDVVDPVYRIGLTQRLPIFGQRGAERREAEGTARAVGYDTDALALDLLAEARGSFYDWFHVARKLDANRDQIGLVERMRAIAVTRYGAGSAEQADALQAEVELAMLEHERAVLERERRVLMARMNALLHRPQGTTLPPPPRTLAPLDSLAGSAASETQVAARSPEINAAEARAEAWEARLDAAGRSRWPETAVGIGYDRFWHEPEFRGTIGLTMSLPIGLGRLGDGEREARAGIAAAQAERAAASDRLAERIAVAQAMAEEARHEVEIMEREVLPASERAFDALRTGYASGRVPFGSLLMSARDVARARLNVHQAQAAEHRAEAELKRALAIDVSAVEVVR